MSPHGLNDLSCYRAGWSGEGGPVQAESYAKTLNAKIEMAAEHPDFGADYGFVVEGARRFCQRKSA